MAAYNSLHAQHRLQNGENPVKKIQLVASCGESDGEVYLDELPDDADMGQIHGRTRRDSGDDTLLAIQARLASMDRKADDYRNEDWQLQAQTSRRLQILERNMRRIALQPVQRVVHWEENGNDDDQVGSESAPFVQLSARTQKIFSSCGTNMNLV